jgi:galactokinase
MHHHYRIPGRIELVGKHVDYAGGRSITCAVDLAITAEARAMVVPVLRVQDSQRPGVVELALNAHCTAPTDHWSVYAAAVVRRLCRDFPEVRTGVDLRLHSNLPESAGLSSSSAFVVAVATSLVEANNLQATERWHEAIPTILARAEYFGAMETGAPFRPFAGDLGVGVRGGAQDPVAILCAQAGHCGVFSYLPATLHAYVPWPAQQVLVVAVSGVEATKTGNARAQYNRVADSMRALASAASAAKTTSTASTTHYRSAVGNATIAALLAQGDRALLEGIATHGLPDFPSDYLLPRFQQFCEEVETVVPAVAAALAAGDLEALGQWVDRSQALAIAGLRNQVPETIALQRSARELGAAAASAFGAGFGGAVWAMVATDSADGFRANWQRHYLAAFPQHAAQFRSFITHPGPGATAVESQP